MRCLDKVLKDSFVISPNPSDENPHEVFRKKHTIQDFQLIWLDTNTDKSKCNIIECMDLLEHHISITHAFTDIDLCVDHLSDVRNDKVLLVLTDALAHFLVPLIHNIVSIHIIFVLDSSVDVNQQWMQKWPKVRWFEEISTFLKSLEQTIRQCEYSTMPISFVSIDDVYNRNSNDLDQSFMYTQLLKEAILDIEYDEQSIKDFTVYCRACYSYSKSALADIAEFERSYHSKPPMWWYTSKSFVYLMLNRALRTENVDIILRMGFFIRDLHQQIVTLKSTQFDDKYGLLTVYRGQSVSHGEFEKLMASGNGLICFNNFLSSSKNRSVALQFAESCSDDKSSVGILYEICINPTSSKAVFAYVNELTNYMYEEEVLFSMHSTFRIEEVTYHNNNLWIVKLRTTEDNDPVLDMLTETIRQDTMGSTGWDRLGQLLLFLYEFDKAEVVYQTILDQCAFDDKDKGYALNKLGYIKQQQGDYPTAVEYYMRAYKLLKEILPRFHPTIINCMSNFGRSSMLIGNYEIALSMLQLVLDFQKRLLPSDHSDLMVSYMDIGTVHAEMKNYDQALASYQKALEIMEKILPSNHPSYASLLCNIGSTYTSMGEYTKALSSHKKALVIKQKYLPSDHLSLASSLNSIGMLYDELKEYPKSLACFEKSVEILEKKLPSTHHDLSACYGNIGAVYHAMGNFSKAVEFQERALEMKHKVLPPDHPEIADLYNSIGISYTRIDESSKALSAFENALKIHQKTVPPNHLSLAGLYNNLGDFYRSIDDHEQALSYCQKAFAICQEHLPPGHPILLIAYHNLGKLFQLTGDYQKALQLYEVALEMETKLDAIHPGVARLHTSLGEVYFETKQYSKALVSYKKALEIQEQTLPSNHLELVHSYRHIGEVYRAMGERLEALPYFVKFVAKFRN